MNPEQQKANADWAANRQTVKNQIEEWQGKIRAKEQQLEKQREAGEDADETEFELDELKTELACLYEEEIIFGDKPPY